MDQYSHEKTPKKFLSSGLSAHTPKTFTSRFLLLSENKAFTPSPSLKNRVVRNPFEHQLHEKLHLPVISSPSLFHAPSTPKHQNKLELFEWTIEELSNLNPVNVIAHETQFKEEVDETKEQLAQAAISSFFSEHQIVPSPMACSLREQKIVLKQKDSDAMKIYNSTALPEHHESGCQKLKCDISTQTVYSFPPNLPKEIEDLLKQYRVDDESNTDEELNKSPDRSMMDISTLRRKLFIKPPESPEMQSESFAVHLSPAPKTPELFKNSSYSRKHNHGEVLKANDSVHSDFFGELSPIGSVNCSPVSSSNNVSMTSVASDVGSYAPAITPASRKFTNKLKKKRLSESFSLLQNEFNDDLSEKENRNNEPLIVTEKKIFARFDSGFYNRDEDSNQMNLSLSHEFMQI